MSYNKSIMKWIALSSGAKKNNEVVDLQTFFNKFDTQIINYDVNFFMPDELKNKLYNEFETVTHIIFLASNEETFNAETMFILGIIFGKHLPIFTIGLQENKKFVELTNSVNFKSLSSALDFFEKKMPDFVFEEHKRLAISTLYNKGIPFTFDSFAIQIEKNNLENCNLFLAAGMDINSCCSKGVPMICHAARKASKKTMEWLLSNGADIDSVSKDRGYSAVMDAVWKSNDELVEMLVNQGANLNFISRDGQSVLVLAIGGSNPHICDLLLKHGADPYIKDKMGMSAFDYATLFKQQHLLEIIKETNK